MRTLAGKAFRARFAAVVKQPKIAFVLIIVDTALTVLNQTTLPQAIGYGSAVKTIVNLLLGLFAFLRIGPQLGAKFQAFIHLPTKVATDISTVLFVLEFWVQQKAGLPVSAIVLGLIQFAGGLGFAPTYVPTAYL